MTGTEILIGAAIAGSLVSAAGAIQQGQAAKKAAKFNAASAERDAANVRAAAQFEEDRTRERAQKVLSAQRAAAGASGIVLEGSPLLVMAETAADTELDALAIRFSSSTQEARLHSEAALSRMEGRAAATAGFFKAGGTLLTGIGSLGGRQARIGGKLSAGPSGGGAE